MKGSFKKRIIFVFALLLVLISSLIAIQWRKGFSYEKVSAPMIENEMPMAQTSKSSARLHYGTVQRGPGGSPGGGGVQFDQIAHPASSLNVGTIELNYNPDLADGSRLDLKVNGTPISTSIPDWLLIPIAKFTHHNAYSCFTLFGWLMNLPLEQALQDSAFWAAGVRIMNYHPKLYDTLLGLRLFHMDILIHGFESYSHIVSLPKENGVYLLGKGESPPDTNQNYQGLYQFSTHMYNSLKDLNLEFFRSWMITDFTRDIQFSTPNNSLQISETPYYFFWRYKSEAPDYDFSAVQDSIINFVNIELQKRNSDQQRIWIIDQLIIILKEYELKHAFYAQGSTVYDVIQLKTDQERRQFLNQYYTSSLIELFIHLSSYMDYFTVVHLTELCKRISDRPDLLRAINPAVWDATVTTMRFGAFFRYCKHNFPSEWQDFIHQVQNIEVRPEIETPTLMYPSGNKAIEALLRANPSIPPVIIGIPDITVALGKSVSINLDDYVTDEDTDCQNITWNAEIFDPGNESYRIRKYVNVKLSNNVNLLTQNKFVSGQNLNSRRFNCFNNAILKINAENLYFTIPNSNSGLSVEIDPWHRIAVISADKNMATENPVLIRFTATDQTGLSDQDTVTVKLVTDVATDPNATILTKYNLFQNYPNPFNLSTNISYKLPVPSHVKIKVYNLLGELIQILVDEEKPAGEYSTGWNGKNENGNFVSSGIYVYSASMKESGEIKYQKFYRMLFVK